MEYILQENTISEFLLEILIFNSICYLLFFAIIYEIHKKPLK